MSRDDPEGGRSLITNPDDDAFSTLMSFKQSRAAGRTSPVQAAETQQARIHESEKFRARFRREARWTLDPTSRRMARWDIVTSVALVFTATVTPFEVCVLPAVPLKEMITDPLSWLNRFVDLIFLTDVIIQSMMRYEENGVTVYDSRKIFMHYARSWMAVDILTAIPVDMLTAVWDEANGWVAEDGSGEENPNAGTGSSAFELVRMIRLVKLGRIIRASRNFRRWQAYLGLSFSFIALIKFAILTTMMAHWLACMWILVGRSQIHTLSHGVQSAYHDDPHAAFGSNWVTKARLNDATPRQLYSVALYIALSNIFSGSSGNIVPASPLEYNMQTVMMLVGSAVWAYVITSGCGILATLDPYGVMYRHQMDELNYFAKDKNLPKEMLWKLREFLTQTQEVQRQARYDLLLDNMSERLKADAALCWARSSLMKVHYFSSGTEDGFLASAALSLKLRVFCRSEQIPVSSLLIIDRGIAARKGRIHLKGSCLGEDMILSSDRFRDLLPGIALTFVVQTALIEKRTLAELLEGFPLARKRIRWAAVRVALYRSVVSISHAAIMAKQNSGDQLDMIEAFSKCLEDQSKAYPALQEPTRRVLAKTINALSDRVEEIHLSTQAQLAGVSASVQDSVAGQERLGNQVARLLAKLDGDGSNSGNGGSSFSKVHGGDGDGSVGGGRSGSPGRPPSRKHRHRSSSRSVGIAVAMATNGAAKNGDHGRSNGHGRSGEHGRSASHLSLEERLEERDERRRSAGFAPGVASSAALQA